MNEPNTHQEAYTLSSKCSLEGNLPSTMEKNENPAAVSDYSSLYKCSLQFTSQDERRQEFLEMQRKSRNKVYDENRGISEFMESDEDSDIKMDCEHASVLMPKMKNYRKRIKYTYRKPMLSEWLTKVPDDLESEWYIKLCPVGVRNIIVAHNFRTRAYKNGRLVAEFESNLPAGRSGVCEKDSVTVLDCIYNKMLKCIFVLDILVWKNCDLCKSPSSLRFFWLKSRLAEISVQEISSTNEYKIIEVPEYPAEISLIEEKLGQPLQESHEIVPLDGILFYHKETWYKSGFTPLVGWLKPYMIPEKLHIPVCEYFMNKKPNEYVSLEHYLLNRSKNRTDVIMKDDNNDSEDKME